MSMFSCSSSCCYLFWRGAPQKTLQLLRWCGIERASNSGSIPKFLARENFFYDHSEKIMFFKEVSLRNPIGKSVAIWPRPAAGAPANVMQNSKKSIFPNRLQTSPNAPKRRQTCSNTVFEARIACFGSIKRSPDQLLGSCY